MNAKKTNKKKKEENMRNVNKIMKNMRKDVSFGTNDDDVRCVM